MDAKFRIPKNICEIKGMDTPSPRKRGHPEPRAEFWTMLLEISWPSTRNSVQEALCPVDAVPVNCGFENMLQLLIQELLTGI